MPFSFIACDFFVTTRLLSWKKGCNCHDTTNLHAPLSRTGSTPIAAKFISVHTYSHQSAPMYTFFLYAPHVLHFYPKAAATRDHIPRVEDKYDLS